MDRLSILLVTSINMSTFSDKKLCHLKLRNNVNVDLIQTVTFTIQFKTSFSRILLRALNISNENVYQTKVVKRDAY